MRTLIIVPAYNERENIARTLDDIRRNAPGIDYIVVNDGSTDGTGDLLRSAEEPFLDLPANLGIGGCMQAGYRYALERGYDIAVQFDGDGQHDARYVRCLTGPVESGRADLAVGSRFVAGEGFRSTFLRRAGIRFLSGLIRVLCGLTVKDATSGMRAANRRMIEAFAEDYATDYPEPESLLAASLMGARVVEVPVRMRARTGGKSSIGGWRPAYYMLKVSAALVARRAAAFREAPDALARTA